MPLFEGLGAGYGTEKVAVIFDIGYAYTKCGFAGDFSPRYIIPSLVTDEASGKERQIWDFSDEADLYVMLRQLIQRLYFRHLLVSATDRRVVVCESILCPTVFRNTLAKVLFQHYQVPSVLFAPHHSLALLTLATNTGLVLDIGYTEALVIPIYEGIHVMKAIQSAPLASKAIHKNVEVLLRETATVLTDSGKSQPFSEVFEHLEEKTLEDIKVRCCFVTNLQRAKKNFAACTVLNDDASVEAPPPPPDMKYALGGTKIINIPGTIREQACEVLFELDNDQISVATLLLDALLLCPLDMRTELIRNVAVIGGTANLPGFYHRLHAELYDLLDRPKYKQNLVIKQFGFHQPPAKANYTAWLGGAIYGELETLGVKSMSRENYNKNDKLPDWCIMSNKLDNLDISAK